MLWEQGEIALHEGRLERARELLRNANDLSARRNLHPEIPLGTSRLAAFGALFGDCRGVGERKPSMEDAFALALCGHTKQANELIQQARARFSPKTP